MLSLADFVARIDAPLLAQLSSADGVELDEAKAQAALDDAAGQIEGYLYKLQPADRPPTATLEAHQVSIALYTLAGNRPGTEFASVAARHKAAIVYLEGIQGGASRDPGLASESPTPRFDGESLEQFSSMNTATEEPGA